MIRLIILIIALAIPSVATANEGWWASNRTRVGYKTIYIGTEIKISEEKDPQLNLDSGAVVKLDEQWSIEPRYRLKLPSTYSYNPFEHQFRISLRLTFK